MSTSSSLLQQQDSGNSDNPDCGVLDGFENPLLTTQGYVDAAADDTVGAVDGHSNATSTVTIDKSSDGHEGDPVVIAMDGTQVAQAKKETAVSKKKKYVPNEYDVYMGRGGLMNRFRNGSLYRTLIVDHFQQYKFSPFKRDFAIEKIINPILEKGGRFFVPTHDLKGWAPGDVEEVIAPKVMQALRDCKKEDGNRAGHIYSTPIRDSKNGQKQTSSTGKEKQTTSPAKKKRSKNASLSILPAKEPLRAHALSFNHPSTMMRKRLSSSSPSGEPSTKMPKLRNDFGTSPAATAAAVKIPSTSLFVAGEFRHNLLLGASAKKPSPDPSPVQPVALKSVYLNESGHLMNTVNRMTGVCGFYHFLLAHHESSFAKTPEEHEGRFVWENIVVPIQKQGGTIQLCRTSGSIQVEINHVTMGCIAKAMRDKQYIREECANPYGRTEATPTSTDSTKNDTASMIDAMPHKAVSPSRAEKLQEDKIGDVSFESLNEDRITSLPLAAAAAATNALPPNTDDEEQQKLEKLESREFSSARREIMTFLRGGRIDVKPTSSPGPPRRSGYTSIPITKPAAGSHNAIRASGAAPDKTPGGQTLKTEIQTTSSEAAAGALSAIAETDCKGDSEREITSSFVQLSPDPVVENGTETCGRESINSTGSRVSEMQGHGIRDKGKVTPVATRKSSRVSAAVSVAAATASLMSPVPAKTTPMSSSNRKSGMVTDEKKSSVKVAPTVTPLQSQSPKTCPPKREGLDEKSVDSSHTNQQKTSWEYRYHELKEYADKHGSCHVPQRDKTKAALGRFVKIQRQYWQRNRHGETTCLSPEREALLDAIGMVWSMMGCEVRGCYDWEQHLRYLKGYKQKKGHCNFPKEGDRAWPKLNRWVEYLRTLATLDPTEAKRRNGRYLTEEERKILSDIGLDLRTCDKLDTSLNAESVATAKSGVSTGKGNVKSVGKPSIGEVSTTRDKKEHFHSRPKLVELHPSAGTVDKIRLQAPIPLPKEKRLSPLAVVKNISVQTKSAPTRCSLYPRKGDAALPSSITKGWSECFKMLKSFQEENGHTQVPYKRSPHNSPMTVLSKFTADLRSQKKRKDCGKQHNLSDTREKLLDAINFEWNASFECTKEGSLLASSKSIPASSSSVVATKLDAVAKVEKNGSAAKVPEMRPFIVDSEGTRWTAYKAQAVDRLFVPLMTPKSIPQRPPTPENWGVELAYESDGSADSLTF